MSHFDAIVVGTGAMGSAAAMHLARRGQKVLAIDRYEPGHNHGSSHGQTRIIRQAYFEHPSYVPLLLRAYELWHELEQLVGEKLFYQVGLLQAGPASGTVVGGVLESAREHQLRVEQFSADEASRRFPGLAIDRSMACVFEPAAGFLLVEPCVKAHSRAAVAAGATFALGDVTRIEPTADGVRVWMGSEVHTASRVVVSGGSWASSLLRPIWPTIPRLKVLRKCVCWLRPTTEDYRAGGGFPTWLVETSWGVFYGFPQLEWDGRFGGGVKVAEHSGGDWVDEQASGPVAVSMLSPNPASEARILKFAAASLPGLSSEVVAQSSCYYTMSDDEHFLVGTVPDFPQLVYAAGFSGHGFKFASVLGEALADLAMQGESRLPIDWLSAKRLGG